MNLHLGELDQRARAEETQDSRPTPDDTCRRTRVTVAIAAFAALMSLGGCSTSHRYTRIVRHNPETGPMLVMDRENQLAMDQHGIDYARCIGLDEQASAVERVERITELQDQFGLPQTGYTDQAFIEQLSEANAARSVVSCLPH